MNGRGIRLAGLVSESVTDGPGIRLTVFVQGCLRACPACHNPQTHDLSGGRYMAFEEFRQLIERELDTDPLISGVTFSGGEPFLQAGPLADLAESVIRPRGLDLMVYTGYTYEELADLCTGDGSDRDHEPQEQGRDGGIDTAGAKRLLSMTDRLVDGPFLLEERDLTLRYLGSRNQRYIDVQASLREGGPVLFGPDSWDLIV